MNIEAVLAENLFEMLPGRWIGRTAEDHAIVEKNSCDGRVSLRHAEVIVREHAGQRTIEIMGRVA